MAWVSLAGGLACVEAPPDGDEGVGEDVVVGIAPLTASCPTGQFVCANLDGTLGPCGDHLTDKAHCGTGCTPCAAGRVCVSGLCSGNGACVPGQFQCANLDGSQGACGDHLTEHDHCGQRCTPCSKGQSCVAGACTGVSSCPSGQFICVDADGREGACGDHKTDAAHCGASCVPCLKGQTCAGGVCAGASTCPAGQFICVEPDGARGACGDHKTDPSHCGPSCAPCAKGRACVDGLCTGNGLCAAGQFQCANPDGTSDACGDHQTDKIHCGPRCATCAKGETCVAGVCTGKPSCGAGQFVCVTADGRIDACGDHKSDSAHCGSDCTPCLKGQSCVAGVCAGASVCPSGQFVCTNLDGTKGPCGDHRGDDLHCGEDCLACAKGRLCVNGFCAGNISCPAGQFQCGNADGSVGACGDHQSDNAACGAGCVACSTGEACVAGVCTGTVGCGTGQFQCVNADGRIGSCSSHQTDRVHCGADCAPCLVGQTCVGGVCSGASTCPAGQLICTNVDGTSGPCGDHLSDDAHCGSACVPCAHGRSCVRGVCLGNGGCPVGQFQCANVNGTMGACGDHLADQDHCGPLCAPCAKGQTCVGGVCTGKTTCGSGQFVCPNADGSVSSCSSHNSDALHCGPRCTPCVPGQTCSNGVCTGAGTCPAGQFTCANVDGSPGVCSDHLTDNGRCGTSCVTCAKGRQCVNGLCSGNAICSPGTFQCLNTDGSPSACSDHATDNLHCGPTCAPCAKGQSCLAGVCTGVPTSCATGQFQCPNPDRTSGPCGDHLTDHDHCGKECVACAFEQTCVAGACVLLSTCPAGQFLCPNADGTFGACGDHLADRVHCGLSCKACLASQSCINGLCAVPATCPSGQFVCTNADGTKGPCGDHLSDNAHCGLSCQVCARGDSCLNGVCSSPSVCTTPGSFVCFDAAGKPGPCGDHLADAAHCGTSCAGCAHGEDCVAGVCTVAPRCATPGQFICLDVAGHPGPCGDHLTDHDHCGPGCRACGPSETCVAGACAKAPPCSVAKQFICANADGTLGGCADHLSDNAHCGPTCAPCLKTETCLNGVCKTLSTCPAGQFTCVNADGTRDGCGDHRADRAHCGPSCAPCPAGLACFGASCSAAVNCPTGQFQCTNTDGTLGACGNHLTDAAHCGPSCATCATGKTCVAGACR